MNLLLDTCTFLWIVAGSDELSTTAAELFRAPSHRVFLSAVSAWEIAVKHSLGRLPLPTNPRDFVRKERERHLIEALPLDETSAATVSQLPDLHRDPFDRMLVCQAVTGGLVLITPDPAIHAYPVAVRW